MEYFVYCNPNFKTEVVIEAYVAELNGIVSFPTSTFSWQEFVSMAPHFISLIAEDGFQLKIPTKPKYL